VKKSKISKLFVLILILMSGSFMGRKYLDWINSTIYQMNVHDNRLEKSILKISNVLSGIEISRTKDIENHLSKLLDQLEEQKKYYTNLHHELNNWNILSHNLQDPIDRLDHLTDLYLRVSRSLIFDDKNSAAMFDRIAFLQQQKSSLLIQINVVSQTLVDEIERINLFIDAWMLFSSFAIFSLMIRFYRTEFQNLEKNLKFLVKEKNHVEKLLQETQSTADNGLWEFDYQAKETKWSPMIYNIYDVDDSEKLTLQKEFSLFLEADRERFLYALKEIRRFKQSTTLELEILTPKDTRKYLKLDLRPIIVSGQVVRAIATVQDISKKRELENQFWNLYNGLPLPLMIIKDTTIIHWNKSSEEFLGVEDASTLQNNHIASFMPMYQNEELTSTSFFRSVLERMNHEDEITEIISFRKVNGESESVKVRILNFQSAGQKMYLLIFEKGQDFFELKEKVEELKFNNSSVLMSLEELIASMETELLKKQQVLMKSFPLLKVHFDEVFNLFENRLEAFHRRIYQNKIGYQKLELSQFTNKTVDKLRKVFNKSEFESKGERALQGVYHLKQEEMLNCILSIAESIKKDFAPKSVSLSWDQKIHTMRAVLILSLQFESSSIQHNNNEKWGEELKSLINSSGPIIEVSQFQQEGIVRISFGVKVVNHQIVDVSPHDILFDRQYVSDYHASLIKFSNQAKVCLENGDMKRFQFLLNDISYVLEGLNQNGLALQATKISKFASAEMFKESRELWIEFYDQVRRVGQKVDVVQSKLSA